MAFHQTLFAAVALLVAAASALPAAHSQLSPGFYDSLCPQAIPTIKKVVKQAIEQEPRMGASLLRLHFHDCFVDGCDGSVLLDDGNGFIGEKTSPVNMDSARGFEVIDAIKEAVDSACYGSVVSCADILAVAARDSVSLLGGPSYELPLGRRDSKTASRDATRALPSPALNLEGLLASFKDQALTLKDLVVLSGAHTIGFAQCKFVRDRATNDQDIDPTFAAALRERCPAVEASDRTLVPLDNTTNLFDSGYYKNLLRTRGVLHSDQQLFKGDGSEVDGLVRYYAESAEAFFRDFGESMVRMGNIKPLTGENGEIRGNCRKPNSV